jgi:hypothetical protein
MRLREFTNDQIEDPTAKLSPVNGSNQKPLPEPLQEEGEEQLDEVNWKKALATGATALALSTGAANATTMISPIAQNDRYLLYATNDAVSIFRKGSMRAITTIKNPGEAAQKLQRLTGSFEIELPVDGVKYTFKFDKI